MYNHSSIDKKWQKRWEDEGVFHAEDFSDKEKFYCLIEFPYPSGSGLHMGHPRSYTALDILARKKRMEGFNVLYPIGWDAFGLPTENYAIKTGRKPQEVTKENIDTFRRQLQSLGISFDWSREVNTTDPSYYKWTQWQFLEFFKEGLAYKDKMAINWCVSCKIGLSNEEVVGGACERCGGEVEKRDKEQWMIAITKYAQRLLDDLDTVDYLPKIKKQQQDWIGRSEGAEVDFTVDTDLSGYNILGLHAFRDDSKEAFWPWLSAELEGRGASVTVLDLPNPSEPNIEEQIKFIKESYTFNEKTIVITHSLGGVAAMKLLPTLDTPVSHVIMVAPPVNVELLDGKERPALRDCCDWKFDFGAISKMAKRFTVLADKNDPAVPQDHPVQIANNLRGELVVAEAEVGHFNGKEEPVILSQLIPSIEVFTTRPDTLFGATYMVLAPEHPLVSTIVTDDKRAEVEAYVKAASKKSDIDRGDGTKEKTGAFTGAYAVNPANGAQIPVWVADYVMMGYGTGAIMAVPAHDERDWAFAKAFDLPIVEVVSGGSVDAEAYAGEGLSVNSDFLDGKKVDEAKEEMIAWLEKNGHGKKTVNYKLRDWVFSRQRYWGEPIPLIHCDSCSPETGGWIPVPEDQLPVELPEVDQYQPTDDGESPLSAITDWVNTECPTCNGPAKRETDTMPNWAGSSWYFLRYIDPHNDEAFADMKKLEYWMPIDLYNGGMEHTVLHLLYSRFWNKVMFDRGHVPVSEPYARRHSHGLILAEDGTKMSKSKGNGIDPDEVVDKYGADTLRMYEMFVGPFEEPAPWNTKGMIGTRRFLDKVARLPDMVSISEDKEVTKALHKTVKKVGEDIENLRFNTAVAQMMTFINVVNKHKALTKESLLMFMYTLCPFAPHIANEVAENLGATGFVEQQKWPAYDESQVVDDVITLAVQVNGKLRATLEVAPDAPQQEVEAAARANENVAKFVEGEVKKVIYVKGRMMNFVV
ncbi:leucine--tRNA ligase [Candidatus Uhrbacteria bacterium]|jgi:leucyl-tRNA synthetase|nr:leucine--tRNA ligase [Candidatus Uhrbacteria bacterium]